VAVQRITIFTDGACKGNPGRGGWAAVLFQNGAQWVVSGHDPWTTNNRMEMLAAIRGLEAAGDAVEVALYSDSSLVINTMTRGWKRNKNQDLWEQLDRLAQGKRITWKWVRGHNGTPGNELADRIASREAGLPPLHGGGPAGETSHASQGAAARPGRTTP
jgi:ribonuclease HI